MRLFARFCPALLVAVTVASCTSSGPTPEVVDDDIVAAEEKVQPRDLVDLTLYFRQRQDGGVHLKPVLREVPVNDDLPRTALTLLLDGPGPDDPRSVSPPLPTTTRVKRFSVSKGTARVRLSRHAVLDARRVGKRPRNEVLAMAAITNTLTEFPDIHQVRLRIAGRHPRRFWGGWRVPAVLVRDESLVGPQRQVAIPPLEGFGRHPKQMGVAQRKRRPPAVAAVRVQSLTTYLRVAVEVTSARGGPLKGPVPPTQARREGKNLVLRVRGNATKHVAGSLSKQLQDPAFEGGRIDVRRRPGEVVVRLRSRRPAQFLLHSLSKPARVVLDVKR